MTLHINENSTLGLLIGTMGSGKSFSIAKMLVEEFIPYYTGEFWTNIPLNDDAIADYCAQRYKMDRDHVKARLRRIPDEEVLLWVEGKSNVFAFMDGVFERRCEQYGHDPDLLDEDKFPPGLVHPLSRSMVVVDEAADFFPKKPAPELTKPIGTQIDYVKKRVRKVRHFGARVLYVFQRLEDIEPAFRDLAEFRVVLTKLGTQPVPYFNIAVDDFAQLFAKFTGVYLQWTTRETLIRYQEAFQKMGSGERFFIHKRFFPFYESHNIEGKGKGAPDLPAFKRLNWKQFAAWFWRRNWWGMTSVTAGVVAVLVCFYPGTLAMDAFHGLRHEFSAAYDEALKKSTIEKKKEKGEALTPREVAADPEAGLNQLRESNLELANRVIELSKLLDVLAEDRKHLAGIVERASQMVMIDDSGIILRSGERVNVGETIPSGAFSGRVLQTVQFRDSQAVLSDGTRLRLQQLPEPVADDGTQQADVSRSLSGTASNDQGWKSATTSSPSGDVVVLRSGNADGPVRVGDSPTSGHQYRNGQPTPATVGNYGDEGAAARTSPGRLVTPVRRAGAPSNGNSVLSRRPQAGG
ncbi:hypothetical protein AB1L30_15995 [Bremerella sp. JC817]|uniref:hypothetical protein n=1 Tax=Bremerella sp. JC817 TaxID=3231756 RepID=UPI003458A1E1